MRFDRWERGKILWERYGLTLEELEHHRKEVSGPNENVILMNWPTPAQARAQGAPLRGARASGAAGQGVSSLTAQPLPLGSRLRDQTDDYPCWSNQKRLKVIENCKRFNDIMGKPYRGHAHRYPENETYRIEMAKFNCPHFMTFVDGINWIEPSEPWA